MRTEQAEKLRFIIRQANEVIKNSLDSLTLLAENFLSVFIDDEKSDRKVLPSAKTEKRLLNKTELAECLGVCVRTVNDLQDEGMPSVNLMTRVLFDYEEVSDWLKDRKPIPRRKNRLRVVK